LPRGTRVRVRVTATDLLTLDVHANVVARLDDAAAAAEPVDDADAEEAAESAGPLTLAIDVKDGDEEPAAAATAA
jgi:exoribonuclease II